MATHTPMADEDERKPGKYPVPQFFVDWLKEGVGRSAYFSRKDPALAPSVISKMKSGRIPITFEYAVRIERAQKPTKNPLKAYDLMTFKEHRELYLYVTGQAPAPEASPTAYKPGMPTHQPRTVALEAQAGA